MGAHELSQRLRDNTKAFGLSAALRDMAYLAARKVVNVKILKGMTAVMDDIDRSFLSAGAYDGRFTSEAELQAALSVPEWQEQMSADFIVRALGKGDRCFGIFDRGTLISVGWYSRKPTDVSEHMTLHFDSDWAYMYKGYTLAAYRGQRLHGVGMSMSCQAYTEEGARGLISYVEFNNLRSLRSVERMGYRIFGDIYLATVGGRERAWSSPGCRPYGFRLEPAN